MTENISLHERLWAHFWNPISHFKFLLLFRVTFIVYKFCVNFITNKTWSCKEKINKSYPESPFDPIINRFWLNLIQRAFEREKIPKEKQSSIHSWGNMVFWIPLYEKLPSHLKVCPESCFTTQNFCLWQLSLTLKQRTLAFKRLKLVIFYFLFIWNTLRK